jgi:hypothetical protein
MTEEPRLRIHWTQEQLEKLRGLVAEGRTAPEIAALFDRPLPCVENAIYRYCHGIPRGTLEENLDIPLFKGDLKLPMDDYIITADYHSPYYSTLWHNRSLAIAERFGIKKLVVIGDLVEFGFAAYFYSDDKPKIEDEAGEDKRLIQSMIAHFEQVYLVKGNHENRLGRNTNGIIKAQALLAEWAGPDYGKRFIFSLYDKLTIGNEWLCVHPKSYSQKAGIASRSLCSKYLKNIINTHGHHVGWNYDPSGKFLAVDLGGMFDPEKVEYINMKTTTHPAWNQGFGMFRNGYFHLFDQQTDWNFWLDRDEGEIDAEV